MARRRQPSRIKWMMGGLIIGFVLGLAVGASGIDPVMNMNFEKIMTDIGSVFK